MKRALITGVTGQDGALLAEHLLGLGYEVHGIKRRSSSFNTARLDHIFENPHLHLHYGDLTDGASLQSVLMRSQPEEIYNLGAQSHVGVSFEIPEYTAEATGVGTLRLLEAIRSLGWERSVRFYQASSSELYGLVQETPQRESTPFYPRSPYGVAKLYAYWIVVNYREAYGMHASNGILFNHEGPTRGETFVTRKVTRAVAAISCGRQEVLRVGNLDARRDWGCAREYVRGMHLMLQQQEPGDYVLATGETHSVREMIEVAFSRVGIKIEWRGKGPAEVGGEAGTSRVLVEIDPHYYRPTEVDLLLGDASKAREVLGWHHNTTFRELIERMVDSDIREMCGD